MPRVIGYGEDALTYWALTKRLESILAQLEDESNPSTCLIVYRPSFGRRGGPGRAEFGEFDAILATPRAVYLIESKWDSSAEVKDGIVKLRREQKLRHRIFDWYFTKWREDAFLNWEYLASEYEGEFSEEFDGKKIAPSGSRLRGNLEYVINQLQSYSKEIFNILLFLKREESSSPTSIPRDFRLVTVEYRVLPGGDFFEVADSRVT